MAETITTIVLMVLGTLFVAFAGYVILSDTNDHPKKNRKQSAAKL